MKSSLQTMKKAHHSTRMYDTESKNINCELMTYAMVLDELNMKLLEMARECFVDSAQSYGLENRELVIGVIRDDLDLEKRRQMLKRRELIDSSCFTLSKIKESLYSFGLDFELYEYPKLYEIVIIAKGEYTKAQQAWIRQEVRKIMPVHQQLHVIFGGPTWTHIDNNDKSFLYMDNQSLTWDQIDNLD